MSLERVFCPWTLLPRSLATVPLLLSVGNMILTPRLWKTRLRCKVRCVLSSIWCADEFFFFVLEAARLATDKAQPSTPSIGIARLTSAQKRERSALRKSPSRAVKIVKRRHRPVQRYTLKQAVLELQTELVTASQLKEIRYNRSQSLQDNVVEFTTKEITTALERAAPNVFGLLTGAYGKCARSGRPIQEGEADDARTFAATHLALLLKACNQRCDRVSKMMTLALMSKDTNKSVRLRLFLS